MNMNEVEINYNMFENIKHTDKYGVNIGMQENYRQFEIIRNGVNLVQL